ncbi:hypothetical protein [Paracoccus xiamenensis]|uniref:hypothetical protein n=1 Tax=Paracoccus xiamenensis TaxID=2714901 RepID=UPI001409F033|nr:hypothetical protein [Paracoccus xiamenensis]NHF72391.1 hypothetical protein [Paracoccus xiamenensis]
MTTTRTEHGSLGEIGVPAGARYGLHSLRALDSLPRPGVGLNHFPELVRSLPTVKEAAHFVGGLSDADMGEAFQPDVVLGPQTLRAKVS